MGNEIAKLLEQRRFRQAAQLIMAKPGLAQELADILTGPDTPAASWAIPTLKELLGASQPELLAPVMPALIRLLEDRREWARPGAAYILSGAVDRAPDLLRPVMTDLAGLLDSRDEQTMMHAASVLEEISKKQLELIEPVVPRLIALLRAPGNERTWAAYTLGEIGRRDPHLVRSAIAPLLRELDGADKFSSAQAAWALGNVSATEALDPIARMQEDASPVSMFESRAMWTDTTVAAVARDALAKINAGKEKMAALLSAINIDLPRRLSPGRTVQAVVHVVNPLDQPLRQLTLDFSPACPGFRFAETVVKLASPLNKGEAADLSVGVTAVAAGELKLTVMVSASNLGVCTTTIQVLVSSEGGTDR